MNQEFDYRKKSVVGLIIIFALLFCCSGFSYYQHRKAIETEKRQIILINKIKNTRVLDPNRPMVALTFDDGPSPYTMPILLELEKHNSLATFFVVGSNVSSYPKELKKMQEMGCEIGNHSTSHPKLTTLKPEGVKAEIEGTNDAVSTIIGEKPTLFRPPYGEINAQVAQLSEAPVIMWSIDPEDWKAKNSAQISEHILNCVQDGDIVLLHDLYETTAQAVVDVIPKLIEKGYQLVTVSELAKFQGVTMTNGIQYGHFKNQQ